MDEQESTITEKVQESPIKQIAAAPLVAAVFPPSPPIKVPAAPYQAIDKLEDDNTKSEAKAGSHARIQTRPPLEPGASPGTRGEKPRLRVLYLFSGRQREGDLEGHLRRLAQGRFEVFFRAMDIVRGDDLSKEDVWEGILKEIQNHNWDM